MYSWKPNVTKALIELANFTSDVNKTATSVMVGDVETTTQLLATVTEVIKRSVAPTEAQVQVHNILLFISYKFVKGFLAITFFLSCYI